MTSSSSSSSEICAAAPLLWQQFFAGADTISLQATHFASVLVLSLAVVWFVSTLWKSWNVSYNLKLLWESAAIAIPEIVLDDLPLSVWQDDGVTAPAPPPGTAAPCLRDPARPGMIQCFDPSTQQWLGQVPAMTAADVHDACVKAARAQHEWRGTTFAQRRTVLRTLQAYLCQHVAEICRVSARDSGKPAVDACLGEVLTTAEKIRTIAAAGELWLQPECRQTGPMFLHKTARVEYVPLGVIATIAPWNYPYVVRLFVVWCSAVAVLFRLGDEFEAEATAHSITLIYII